MSTGIRERWAEVRALFEAALDLPVAERAGFVATRAGDEVLRSAVLALLASETGSIATGDPTRLVGRETPAGEPELRVGELLGLYRVLRVLGRGGMGVVYLAQQAQPKREVAIKRIAGQHDTQTLARFRREADLLARLSHPGIAQIIELASDGQGRPFLVMEYVAGQPLAEHVRGLPREQRLHLLARIADAVDHAHSRGIVHRDLKPSNILVGTDGQPKILDFGIGTLCGAGNETLTATGMVLGTPAYMSPEQAFGHSDVDARADVYALGAIGYELLADRLPLPVSGLTPLQALRVVGEDTPAPLGRVDASLRGDLETVIDKALAKDKALRYANAGALADDLRRFLHAEPIQARRPGWMRRASLFAKRNPLAVALGSAAALSLLVGTAVSLWFAWSEAAERARAVAEAQRAEAALAQSRATLSALGQVFSAGNPVVAGRPEVSFRDVLASAAAQIAQVPAATRAHVLFALAEAQLNLGENAAAAQRFEQVQQLALEAGDEALHLRAGLARVTQMVEEESPVLAQARIDSLLARPRLHEAPLVEVALWLQACKVAALRDRYLSALNHLGKAQALWNELAPTDDIALRNVVEATLALAQLQFADLDGGGAAAVTELTGKSRQLHDRLVTQMGPEHPTLLRLRINADLLDSLVDENPEWARRLVRELDERIVELGAAHPAILARLDAAKWGRITDVAVERRLRQIMALSMRALPLTSRWRGRVAASSASGGWLVGDRAVTTEELLELAQAQCPPGTPQDLDCVRLRAQAAGQWMEQGQLEAAIALLQELQGATSGDQDPGIVQLVNWQLAVAFRRAARYDEAAAVTDASIAMILANPELDEHGRDAAVLEASFNYRPRHCERVLHHVLPREERLFRYPETTRDTIARLLATCEVRVGRDPEAAISRLDRIWEEAVREESTTKRAELVLGYLEVFHLLGRDAEFERWAFELDRLVQAGLPTAPIANERFPGVERALELTRKGR